MGGKPQSGDNVGRKLPPNSVEHQRCGILYSAPLVLQPYILTTAINIAAAPQLRNPGLTFEKGLQPYHFRILFHSRIVGSSLLCA
jgi:hypothetical protein